MKIKVMLVREYELIHSMEELGFDSIDDITGMEELEVLDDEAKVTTTWMVEGSAEVVEE